MSELGVTISLLTCFTIIILYITLGLAFFVTLKFVMLLLFLMCVAVITDISAYTMTKCKYMLTDLAITINFLQVFVVCLETYYKLFSY